MSEKEIYPWGWFEIDDSTGLPKVEDNQFWRVERLPGRCVLVTLRERRRGWFSRELASRTGGYDSLNEYRLLNYCAQALDKYRGDLERKRRASPRSLLGDYPPKRLES